GQRFYITPEGKSIADNRKVGPIYPNVFAVVRKGYVYDFIKTEEEDKGCNLQDMFLNTIYSEHGYDTRKFLNAIATSSSACAGLPSSSEIEMCNKFHRNSFCGEVTPLAFIVHPLKSGENYLTLSKKGFNCSTGIQPILDDVYISKASREWSKIEKDLVEQRRSAYTKDLKNNAPVAEITKQALEINPSANSRDIQFAINDWVYKKSQLAKFEISDQEISPIVEARYSPSSAMKNVVSFKGDFAGKCVQNAKRYNAKVYAEGLNIPAHEALIFANYVDRNGGCICK
ncbi:MAG TPA: hypothetical protein V6C96_00155, partial [Vampirovibrionales bacterium]